LEEKIEERLWKDCGKIEERLKKERFDSPVEQDCCICA